MEIKSLNTVDHQYNNSQLFESILETLEKSGITNEMIKRKHISAFDEFHVRGREVTKELLANFPLNENHKVLDVGCGLGGPCRMIADQYQCEVKGVDLSSEYVRTAQKLSSIVGLENRTEFIQADALQLPFKGESFDLVITQHVQMNIEKKEQFYAEIKRVLKPGGKFLYYDVFGDPNENLPFPLPWANDDNISFLMKPDSLATILKDLGMKELSSNDQTGKGEAFLSAFLAKAKSKPGLLTGQKLLMGQLAEEKLANIYRSLAENKIVLQSGVWEK